MLIQNCLLPNQRLPKSFLNKYLREHQFVQIYSMNDIFIFYQIYYLLQTDLFTGDGSPTHFSLTVQWREKISGRDLLLTIGISACSPIRSITVHFM